MKTLSQHEIWEEIIFGNTDRYRHIVDAFPDTAEFLSAPNVDPPAESVVDFILNGTAEELVREAIDDPRRHHHYGFTEWIRDELFDLIGECPRDLQKEVAEVIQDDLENPEDLPVQWPNEG